MKVHALGAAITVLIAGFALTARVHETYSIAWWLGAMTTMSAAVLMVGCNRSARISVPAVIGWAMAMRIAAAFTPAFFEDDFYRYLWDGYRTLIDGHAYVAAPSTWFGDARLPPKIADTLSHVNYPNVPTIYGPALQHLFAAGAWINAGELWPWKLMVCAADMVLVAALVKTFGARSALLYAFSPLVVHEIAVAAHPDGLIGALIFFAWLAARKQRVGWLAILLGTAIAMKVHAVIALPFLLLAMCMRAPHLAMAVIATACVYAMHWLPYRDGFQPAWQSFFTFARDWQFNALGFALINAINASFARSVAAAIIIALFAACWWWQRKDPAARNASAVVCAFAALLLFSPVINPWYLLWLLPLACGTRWITPWVAASVVLLSYATDLNLGFANRADGRLPPWVAISEGAAIAAAMVWDVTRRSARAALQKSNIYGCFEAKSARNARG
jgi:alpha-1,6-mannosyltransferase